MEKSADAFRTISEVAADLALPQHVLRFWEQRFPQIKPLKRAGGRRYYRPLDVLLLRSIRRLLYDEGYTIKGVQRLLKEQGARGLRADEPGSAVLDDLAPDIMPPGLVEPASTLAEPSAPDPPAAEEPVADSFGVALRDALACIEDCERILAAVHRARP